MMSLMVFILFILSGFILFLLYKLNLEKYYYQYKSSKLEQTEHTFEKQVEVLEADLQDLHRTAYVSAKTQIWNLEYFKKRADSMFRQHEKSKFTLIGFSISNMGEINRLYGPTEGDKAVLFAAGILKDITSLPYLYAHVQSNLFGLLLHNYSRKSVLSLIEDLSAKLSSYSKSFAITAVFGIYEITDRSMPINDMLNCASLAQKEVKEPEKVNYAFFTENLHKELIENKIMSQEMETALENHKFLMYLQPMIDLHTYLITSAEALVRWEHPEKGILSPYAFLPLFESTKLMLKLDYYMWEEVCKTIRHWIDNKMDPVPVTLNISPIHLQNQTFIDALSGFTEKYKINRKMLILELPERGLVSADSDVIASVDRLAELGFVLCIDNFGSFHSPVNLLKDLPVTYVKLDRKFLSENVSSQEGLTILRYLIAMAKELNLMVITEGVETLKQANFLTEIGCDTAQGFFFSKPINLRTFDQLNKKLHFSGYHPNEYYPTFADMEKGTDIMEIMLTP